jgi:hypothetical protein
VLCILDHECNKSFEHRDCIPSDSCTLGANVVTWLRSWTSAAVTCKVSRWLSVSTAIWTLEPRRHFALSYQPGCHFRVSIGVCGYRKSPPRAQPYAPAPAASRRADLGPWRQTRQRCTSDGFLVHYISWRQVMWYHPPRCPRSYNPPQAVEDLAHAVPRCGETVAAVARKR